MGTTTTHDSTSGHVASGKTQDVFQTIVKSRKSYKMLKGASEAVWPPYLEEALLKGFESYEPEDCRETRLLGRFPMRNQYISDYIYRATGKRRTAKQVGSRLQQLRETFEGKRLLNSLTQHYNLGGKPLSSQTSASSADSPVSDASSSSEFLVSATSSSSSARSRSCPTPLDTSIRRTFVCIELLPMDQSSTCSTYDVDRSYRSSVSADGIFSSNGVTNVFRPSSHPRPICTIDPTITFVSQSAISAQSSCSVLLDGETVHTEVTPLTLTGSCPDGPRTDDCPLLYGVQLVPNYWQFLCQCPNITRYTIVQHVTRFSSFSQSEGVKDNSLMFSAVYHFSYPRRTNERTPSPSSTHDVRNNEAYSFAASNLDNRLSNSWYSDLLSPADVRALSYTPDGNVEHHLTMSEGSEECDRSVGSFSEDSNAVSPISSCFPADLSNYIV